MKIIKKVLLASLLVLFPSAMTLAGTNHDHGHSHAPISADDAKIKAVQRVKKMVEDKKIDPTWREIKSSQVKQKDFGHGPEWVVVFENKKINDPAKQTLYLFYSQDGHYLAANYDGS